MNSLEENIRIVEAALLTTKNKDHNTQKKFLSWFCGPIDEESDLPVEKANPAVQAVVPALKRILKRFHHVTIKQKSGFATFGAGAHSFDQNTPMEILCTLFSGCEQLKEPVLQEIAVELIEYLQYFFGSDGSQGSDILGDQLERFKTTASGLIHMARDLVHESICYAFATLFNEEMTQLSAATVEVPPEGYKLQSVNLITFYLKEIYKPE
jgi:hypothetical protein